MQWAEKRKIVYASAVFVFLIAFLTYQFRDVLFPEPTCFDAKKNGFESDIDCGGVCALRCASAIAPISVEWVRALRTGPMSYDLVAMLANNNVNSAPQSLAYTFVLLDASGNVMKMEFGSTTPLVSGNFPVIRSNVPLPSPPASVSLRISPAPYYATRENPTVPAIRVSNFDYEGGSISRISVNVINTTRTIYQRLPLRIVAYDEKNNVVAAGESIIPELGKEESEEVIFTWHSPLPSTPIRFRGYPIVSPF